MTRREEAIPLSTTLLRRLLAGDVAARQVVEGILDLEARERREAAGRLRRASLGELWTAHNGVVIDALNHLGLEPRTGGKVIRVRCPRCGEREAFLYPDMVAPGVSCNRRNKCPLGRSQRPVMLFALLVEREGSRRAAMDLIRRWAGKEWEGV